MTRNLRTLRRILLLGTSLVAFASYAGEGAHWSYSGASGPDHWAELSKEFAACAEGRNQSPIDIATPVEASLSPIELRYSGQTTTLLNSGYTIQVDVAPGNLLSTEGLEFELVQFHFHSPSENRVQGELFPLETHFVHKGAGGELAALAVLFRSGAAEPGLESIWANIPAKAGESTTLELAPEWAELHSAGSLLLPTQRFTDDPTLHRGGPLVRTEVQQHRISRAGFRICRRGRRERPHSPAPQLEADSSIEQSC